MRTASLLSVALLVVLAGSAEAGTARHTCTHVSRGFRACTTFTGAGEKSAIFRRSGATWSKVAGPAPGRAGWWRRVVAARDRRTLLAQWSGECEAQSTYFVSSAGGRVRPIFRGHDSAIVGWTRGGRALVRLNEAIWRGDTKVFAPGVYRVDPVTLGIVQLRVSPPRPGC